MSFSTLSEWLNWIPTIHPLEIELSLNRVQAVAFQLNLLSPSCPIICVAGTNGKGSTVTGLAAIYQAAGYCVGTFTSPILFRHQEQITINGRHPEDQAFCMAFEKIEHTRKNISLTPFEFYTLAALLLFQQESLDLLILEVGLGGRLDAVNILDASLAIVTSIDLDHTHYLGTTREAIAFEKAGIFRQDKPAIYGDLFPPTTLLNHAKHLNTPLFCQGRDFIYHVEPSYWSWSYHSVTYTKLPLPSLALQNMSLVLMAVKLLQSSLPVNRQAIDKGLLQAKLPGRIQILPGEITKIFDVSHNPAAISFLSKQLKGMSCLGNTYAVFSMLLDKDIVESIKSICSCIDHWFCAPLAVKRGAAKHTLIKAFDQAVVDTVSFYDAIEDAFQIANMTAKPQDRIVVFGSFHTVAAVWGKLIKI
ncbi:MAG TPA: bifunctional tetrahydrofolate synthase/dihydrofolate synthase [Gammaproteobacteria bacterium]|nr:bifunctional tetrahydrofolate synthase/dihydrofolate synthase [Gammaproteobacteria bacterium]